MKPFFLFIILPFCIDVAMAQSVGIGTTTPDPKAQLDIRSTSKGLLIPSMTTSQRLGISTPPNGLLVYDTDKNEFYHYNSDGWTGIVNGTYWNRPITSRNRIATTDSVGIGTTGPTQRLDVNGNIRSRNNIIADGNLSSTNLNVSGIATVGSSAYVNGNITSNASITAMDEMVINNAGAALQLKSANVNKGYFQLSGDNVRMGTNSGNSEGELIIRMNGTDRISVDPAGTMKVPGKITTTSSGTKNMLPICYGYYFYSLNINRGSSNYSITRVSTGEYNIYCTRITANTVIIAQPRAIDIVVVSNVETGPTGTYVRISTSREGESYDHGFSFVMFEG